MSDLPEIAALKRETKVDLEQARERRQERDARTRRNGPIIDAFDRMAHGEAVEHQPGPRHAPQLTSVPDRRRP